MTFNKLKKEDFKTYRYQFVLSLSYTIIIAIIYSYWVIKETKFYFGIIVFIGVFLLGSAVFYFWVNHLKKKSGEKVDEQ